MINVIAGVCTFDENKLSKAEFKREILFDVFGFNVF